MQLSSWQCKDFTLLHSFTNSTTHAWSSSSRPPWTSSTIPWSPHLNPSSGPPPVSRLEAPYSPGSFPSSTASCFDVKCCISTQGLHPLPAAFVGPIMSHSARREKSLANVADECSFHFLTSKAAPDWSFVAQNVGKCLAFSQEERMCRQ